MSKPKWTEEQQSVIDSRGGNLLVAAAAGSGKTAVLVQRIIDMITDAQNPIDIDKLLVVTFTNAAAAEMKERVQHAIEKLIQSDGDNEQLKRQLILLEQASITTIHSFCLEVIKEYFFEIDLSASFRIGTEQECSLLKLQAMEDVFNNLYDIQNSDFLMLIDKYSSTRGDNNIKEIILNMYHFVVSSPTPTKWLDNSAEEFNIDDDFDFLKSDTGQALIENIRIELEGVCQTMEMIVDQTHGISELHSYHTRYVNEQRQFNKVLNSLDSSWDCIRQTLDAVQYEDYRKGVKRVPTSAELSIKSLQKSSKKIRDKCKETLSALRSDMFFRSEEDIRNEYKELYPIMKSVSGILKMFIDRYQEKKKLINIIDFNDIEHFALKILTTKGENGELNPSEIAKIYSEKFEEIFIDEYQDSNLTQEVLLTSISKKGKNRFMVGDIKQSIYKFRQARPDIFLDKYDNYSTSTLETDKKILLHKNFRSRAEVLDATNYIFEHIMCKTVGGLEYGEPERLNLGGFFKENIDDNVIVGGAAEVHLIFKDKKHHDEDEILETSNGYTDTAEDEEELDKIQHEARVIGNIIQDLIKPHENGQVFKVIDKGSGEYRSVNYGDIVILLRSVSNWQETIGKELGKMGIPVAINSASGYFKSLEITVVTTLLKTINNILDDLMIVGTLRSPMFNFKIDEIMKIREHDTSKSYYESILDISQEEHELGIKCKIFKEKITQYITFSQNNSIHKTIQFICEDTGFYSFVTALTEGDTRKNNLDLLVERAENFELNSKNDLHSFIAYLDELQENDKDLEGAKPELDNTNSVNLMTIHKSKGLEFPVVICAGMGKQFNNMDLKNTLLYHTDLGYGPQVFDLKRKITYPSIKKEALKNKMLIENLAEEIRVLYVALTRPKEKLIITGLVNDIESCMEKWGALTTTEGTLPAYGILRSNTYLDWIMPSVLKHADFKELRKDFMIEDTKESKHPSSWSYKLWNTSNIPYNESEKLKHRGESINIDDTISHILSNYNKNTQAIDIYTPDSIAVTELVDVKNESRDETPMSLAIPNYLKEETSLTAAQIGTIVHEVMQKINIRKTNSISQINEQIDSFIEKGLILKEEATFINRKKILSFFKSELGKRITSSSYVKQEQPISIYVNANEIYDKSSDKKILVNGIVDTYFEEGDDIVIVDYKTDSVIDGEYQKLIQTYEIQLKMYKKAVEKITGKKVKECYLYLFSTDQHIRLL